MRPVRKGPRVRRAPRRSPEFDEQCALFEWARIPAVVAQYPGIDLLEGSMNGVKLSKAQAGKAKAAGMLKGAHDVRLPVARGGYIGLSVEMKAGKNKPTTEQLWYGERLEAEGHCVRYAWTWPEAKDAIVEYLSLPRRT
ncbi:hypothetical protein KMC46_gp58 [Ralstonia phage Gamede]|uniref:VRR-NUC domain-containing protein n=1 Tax=Ralstonia phage Gamede TaxID=2759726 RepID=A0A7M1IE25_9CAUD|nr:hypothetical protein KMC46_gp58 [Ralstonia phage Gamede]QOQ37827.1 hypothetical protein 9Ga_00066 [Ralstonia phage Gamede]